MVEPLTYRNQGRNPRTFGALAIAGGLILFLYSIGTMYWLIVLLSLFAIPALFDVLLNPVATFELNDTILRWKSPTQTAEMRVDQIRAARFDTRLDVSVRATLTLADGSKLRVPQDVLPSHKTLEEALKARGIKVERHHFRVI
ncbi:hypothetical protein [Shimia abyssi]|uniref:PH (Pleckstrin Homology) domain-containing protein n=1 Tax=Shimia abyssi TaxID=1662395 RepID=A0A2P8FJL3_9RHOB|nr:hypothetical protein [Shimia abyssi]PSL21903.1 hypothetical protein CLV88_101327 [Shimia abyssi]